MRHTQTGVSGPMRKFTDRSAGQAGGPFSRQPWGSGRREGCAEARRRSETVLWQKRLDVTPRKRHSPWPSFGRLIRDHCCTGMRRRRRKFPQVVREQFEHLRGLALPARPKTQHFRETYRLFYRAWMSLWLKSLPKSFTALQ
jgi:hypothetical protein